MNLRVGKGNSYRYIFSDCFALPTVLISSIIMLGVLLSTMVMITSTRAALKEQLNNMQTRLASEAGEAYAKACLSANYGISRWTNEKPLKPQTDCTGTNLTGVDCAIDTICSVSSNNDSKEKTVFSIGIKEASPPDRWKTMSAGGFYTCAISYDDRVYCWGSNSSGQLGDGSTSNRYVPTRVNTDDKLKDKTVVDISAGSSSTCAITSELSNNAYCWGDNGYGQTGNGNTINYQLLPTRVIGDLKDKNIKAISVGGSHVCAVTSEDVNNAYCWGDNTTGQIGDGTTTTPKMNPTLVTGALSGKTILAISAEYYHTCAITNESTNNMYCWGDNSSGQIGDGTTITPKLSPTLVTGALSGKTMTAITTGRYSSCAITNESTNNMYCWGYNNYGQIGDGTSGSDKSSPTLVTGSLDGKRVVYLSAGYYSACALTSESSSNTYCWGWNCDGQIGDGNNGCSASKSTPTLVVGGLVDIKTVQISASNSTHTCAITDEESKNAYCWGRNTVGEVGNGAPSGTDQLVPATINILGVYVDNLASSGSTNYVRSDGSIWRQSSKTKRYVSGSRLSEYQINPQIILAGKSNSSCLTDTANKLFCWGDNTLGQLGDGTTELRKSPVAVAGALSSKTVSKIATGSSYNCTVTSDSTNNLYCWGYNMYGQIGDGTSGDGTNKILPTLVTGLLSGKAVTNVSAYYSHTCAITNDSINNLYCWGYNYYGQLGDWSGTSRSSPVLVTGSLSGKQVTSVSVGYGHTCAITGDLINNLYCWGNNYDGQLGDGTSGNGKNKTTPTLVAGGLSGKSIALISTGYSHTCAVTNDSTSNLYCWGNNGYGQVGDGTTTTPKVAPVQITGLLNTKNVVSVSAGHFHTCVLTNEAIDNLYCWGYNNQGQIGNGTYITPQLSQTHVIGVLAGKNVLSVSAGDGHTCAISEGQGYCWGNNGYGQLGINSLAKNNTPVKVIRKSTTAFGSNH